MENVQKTWKPKRWLATLLSLFIGCSGMLYLGKGKWYLIYILSSFLIAGVAFLTIRIPLLESINLFSLFGMAVYIICAIHTYRLATLFQASSHRPWYSHWWGMLSIYSIIAIPMILSRSFLYEPFYIPSRSMVPSYNKGDYIIISKFGYGNYGFLGFNIMHTTPSKAIQRGDVVVFAHPPNPKVDFIMRVIGLPNDKITYTNKTLSINEKPLLTNVLTNEYDDKTLLKETLGNVSWQIINTPSIAPNDFEISVPPHSYFVMGDNRDNSNDSRYWGNVPAQNIKGKVIYTTTPKH